MTHCPGLTLVVDQMTHCPGLTLVVDQMSPCPGFTLVVDQMTQCPGLTLVVDQLTHCPGLKEDTLLVVDLMICRYLTKHRVGVRSKQFDTFMLFPARIL